MHLPGSGPPVPSRAVDSPDWRARVRPPNAPSARKVTHHEAPIRPQNSKTIKVSDTVAEVFFHPTDRAPRGGVRTSRLFCTPLNALLVGVKNYLDPEARLCRGRSGSSCLAGSVLYVSVLPDVQHRPNHDAKNCTAVSGAPRTPARAVGGPSAAARLPLRLGCSPRLAGVARNQGSAGRASGEDKKSPQAKAVAACAPGRSLVAFRCQARRAPQPAPATPKNRNPLTNRSPTSPRTLSEPARRRRI